MKKNILLLLLTLFSLNLIYAQTSTIEPELQEVLNQKSDEMISINIILKSQADVQKLQQTAAKANDRKSKREIVVNELKSFSKATQGDIMSILDAESKSGKVEDVRCHWLVNAISCNASKDVIYHIARHNDVEFIAYNEMKYLLWDEEVKAVESTRGMTQNITHVKANQVWDLGYTGQGVTVAVIDTGVNFSHIDLADHLWDGGEEYPNHGYNTLEDSHNVSDGFGHGTHCAGVVCGDGTSGTQTGIAPNATLMCIKVMDDTGYGNATSISAGMEFAIEHGADVLNMSLGIPFASAAVREMLRGACVNALQCGIAAAVAVGNDGQLQISFPVPNNVRVPGGCPPPWIHPDQASNTGELSCVVAIGAVNYNDEIAYFSSHGPVTWQATEFADYAYQPGIGLIRPDICAPGVSILSLDYSSNNGHTSMNGTSMATPCVAGIMCLMLEKDPSLTPADICRILETTSVKLSNTKSNKTGTGRVDALAAMNAIDNGDFRYVSHKINDKNGNNNGNINPGENVNIDITFNNSSDDSFSNVKAVLRSSSEYITITDSIAEISINAKENVTIENIFAVTLDANTTPRTLVAFDVYFYNENNEVISYIRVPVYVSGSEIQFSSFIIQNDNNGNGLLEAGETADLGIVLNNIGNEIAVGLKGVISTTNSKLTINSTEAEFSSIGENSSAVALFNVTLADNAGDNFKLPIKMNVTDAFNNAYEFEGTYKKSCEIIFELYDTSGDGWNKAALVVSYSDGTPDEAFTIQDGKTKTYKRKIANDVEISLSWVKGTWDLENSFIIKNESDNIIYRNGGFLNNGFLYSWVNNCSCQNNSFDICEPVKSINADVNKDIVIITWTAPDQDIVKYEIYRDTKYVGETDGLSFVDTEIEHNRAFAYTYSVRPVYEDCDGAFRSVTAKWGVNVNEYSHDTKVTVYPNPTNDKIYIVTEAEIEEVVVYDIYGRQQDYKTTGLQGNVTVDVTKLNAGIYFIKINTEEGNIVKRIIKQ